MFKGSSKLVEVNGFKLGTYKSQIISLMLMHVSDGFLTHLMLLGITIDSSLSLSEHTDSDCIRLSDVIILICKLKALL